MLKGYALHLNGLEQALLAHLTCTPLTFHCCFRTDRVTSVMIPLALTAVGTFVVGKGLYHMYTGTGKLE